MMQMGVYSGSCVLTFCYFIVSLRDDAEGDSGAPSMGAKSLCIPFEQPAKVEATDKCINPRCAGKPQNYTLFGRSY